MCYFDLIAVKNLLKFGGFEQASVLTEGVTGHWAH
jgi:hypothetical protein